jgi:hypothetical protein
MSLSAHFLKKASPEEGNPKRMRTNPQNQSYVHAVDAITAKRIRNELDI